ncbi:MAG: AAA family ATPase [Thermoguttaceae bacterium]|nr:AAA family ATPase [Thermoguttaceae bacterium]
MTTIHEKLGHIELTREAWEVLLLASMLAKEEKLNYVAADHLFVALLVYTQAFDRLFDRKIEVCPDYFKEYLEKVSDKFNVAFSTDQASWDIFDFNDELSTIFDTSVPGTEGYDLIYRYRITRFDTIHFAWILCRFMPEIMRSTLIQCGLPNDHAVVDQIAYTNFVRYYDSRPQDERVKDVMIKVNSLRSQIVKHVPGQKEAAEKIVCTLRRKWLAPSEDGKALSILLLGPQGIGKTRIFQSVEKAFISMKIQYGRAETRDMTGFVHHESFESTFLGTQCSYKNAKQGCLYQYTEAEPFGLLLFENINLGTPGTVPLLQSFIAGEATDLYYEKRIESRNNIVFCTITTDQAFEDFVEKSAKRRESISRHELVKALCQNPRNKHLFGLLNTFDEIIILKKHTEDELKEILIDAIQMERQRLKKTYNAELNVSSEEGFCRLLLENDTKIPTPESLLSCFATICDGYESCFSEAMISGIDIEVPDLPNYEFEKQARIRRGDFLSWKSCSTVIGDRVKVRFEDVRYQQSRRIEYGDWLPVEHPAPMDKPVGVEDQLDRVRRIIAFLLHPERFKMPNGTPVEPESRCAIMVGAPGTGKTNFARYLAYETKLPFIPVSSSQLVDLEKVQDLFRVARLMAPCIVFADEFDSIGSRDVVFQPNPVIHELLQQLDGFGKKPDILFLAATNYLDRIDPALIRKGRLGEVLQFSFPSTKNRAQYLRGFLEKNGITLSSETIDRFVQGTEGEPFSTIAAILRETNIDLLYKNLEPTETNFRQALFARLSELHSQSGTGFGFCGLGKREK